jgi:integrase
LAREVEKLTALAVTRQKHPGLYGDGRGLYLQVKDSGAKSWLYRYMLNGRAREMGLGPLHTVTLSQARGMATDCHRLRHQGVDPIDARNAERARARLEAAKAITFREAAVEYVKAHQNEWRNSKHAAQWGATLKTYAEPVLGRLPVQFVDTGLVLKVLEPIWAKKPETAKRVRGRIEAILDWARTRAYRTGENPARWRGHLENLLAKPSKAQSVEHHAALPYKDIPEFMEVIRHQDGVAPRMLEFAILTACRTNEVIGSKWSEIDWDVAMWVVPAERMKAGREHRVPLSDAANAILREMKELTGSEGYIFPGGLPGRGLSNMAMLVLLQRRMGRKDLTVHGFRSTFRDWAAEETNYPSEVAEMALAHMVGDKVEAAYRRGDLFEKRKAMMADWACFCGT